MNELAAKEFVKPKVLEQYHVYRHTLQLLLQVLSHLKLQVEREIYNTLNQGILSGLWTYIYVVANVDTVSCQIYK